MIESLSTMLKAALDRNGRTKIPLSEELGYVDAYLYIIRERLGEGFRVHKDIDESILALPVPRLVLQPLVENAVEHDITANRVENAVMSGSTAFSTSGYRTSRGTGRRSSLCWSSPLRERLPAVR